jgi:hypothetical protein
LANKIRGKVQAGNVCCKFGSWDGAIETVAKVVEAVVSLRCYQKREEYIQKQIGIRNSKADKPKLKNSFKNRYDGAKITAQLYLQFQ